MNNREVKHFVTLSALKEYYIMSLDNSLEFKYFFGEESYNKSYRQEIPTLTGLIRYIKRFKVKNPDTVIISKNNTVI